MSCLDDMYLLLAKSEAYKARKEAQTAGLDNIEVVMMGEGAEIRYLLQKGYQIEYLDDNGESPPKTIREQANLHSKNAEENALKSNHSSDYVTSIKIKVYNAHMKGAGFHNKTWKRRIPDIL